LGLGFKWLYNVFFKGEGLQLSPFIFNFIIKKHMDNIFRIEHDTLGDVEVPATKLWAAQTQRSLLNFNIGDEKMPVEIINAYALVKKSAAIANNQYGILSEDKKDSIVKVCDEILEGKHNSEFPLSVWQTGSGTQTNMNLNEVIANRAHLISGGDLSDQQKFLHPNDDVNKSQSSNDTFPTAMHIAAYTLTVENIIPSLKGLIETLKEKSKDFSGTIKIGRTHWMDATPLTLGQEFSGYASQLEHALMAIENTLPHLLELAIGGTAVGTGINAPKGFSDNVTQIISEITGYPFVPARNKFEALASHDAMVETHGAFKQLAVSLTKIANDIRIMASGPRSGIGEISLPANEPGSSIMPGKVNPTQVEALTMACAQVIGNDSAITIGGLSGSFELNVYKPLIAYNFIQSAKLLAQALTSFNRNCVVGIGANLQNIEKNLNNSLMLVTSLNPHIGYEKAAEVAKKAYAEGINLKEAAIQLGYVTEQQYNQWVDPKKMV